MITQIHNPPCYVIDAMIHNPHIITIYAKSMPYGIRAEIVEFNLIEGIITLEAEYFGSTIECYLGNGELSFDIECVKSNSHLERETYSLSNIKCKLFRMDSAVYRFQCKLPNSVFFFENRGAVRIPFILGMQCRAKLEIYRNALVLIGKVKNISSGGCLLEISLSDSMSLDVGQVISGVSLDFPNGESLYAEGLVKHVRPFGNHGYAAIGIQFINLSSLQFDFLINFIRESEKEAAFRSGMKGEHVSKSKLFIPGVREKKALQRELYEREKMKSREPIEKKIYDIAQQLQIGLMYLKTNNHFSEEIFYDCADNIIHLLTMDRKGFLSSLPYIREESEWVRHSINVASKLADILILQDPHKYEIKEYVLGVLLHNMGKPLLISAELPSLKLNMTPMHKDILKQHSSVLLSKINRIGWVASWQCEEVIVNANEKLDGSGYPFGISGYSLSPIIRLISVIKAIDKYTHPRNGLHPISPLSVYRKINSDHELYDKNFLVNYMKVYGIYPIGSLVIYSRGFLAWVLDIDTNGVPVEIKVIKDLRYPSSNISSILSGTDIHQLGELQDVVYPDKYDIKMR